MHKVVVTKSAGVLLTEAQANVTAADAVLETLKSVLAARFETRAVALRRSAGKDTGIVRVIQGDYEVVAELPKRVKWDSKKLPDLLDSLPADVAKDLVRVKIDIDERAFLGLSDLHKAALLPARTVET
jgi:hypothetical protein